MAFPEIFRGFIVSFVHTSRPSTFAHFDDAPLSLSLSLRRDGVVYEQRMRAWGSPWLGYRESVARASRLP